MYCLSLKWKSEEGKFILFSFAWLLYLSYLCAGFAQKGCLIKPLLHFLYYYNIYITLKFPLSCKERILMPLEYPKDIILVYFQSQKSFHSSSVNNTVTGKTNPMILPFPAFNIIPVHPATKSLAHTKKIHKRTTKISEGT